MFRRSKTTVLKKKAANGKDLAAALAQDKKFRRQLLSAIGHGAVARRRAASRVGFVAAVSRLSADEKLRRELGQMPGKLDRAATIGGRKAEWDAKILEQDPDRRLSWVSEDGKKTRGTVTFEERGASRTLIRLSLSDPADGPTEAAGPAYGVDAWRVRGDLERF